MSAIDLENQEKFQQLQKVIDEWKDKEGPLMPVLHSAQEIFGCLSLDVQKYISKELDIPVSDIYGVATFYSQFTLKPKGKYRIGVCMGTACYVKGAQAILDELKKVLDLEVGETSDDGLFTLDATRCLGACGLAPIMMINDDVYGRLKPEDVKGIIDKYRDK
ncbi:MAG: NADH-quinone oxidoreductase subunit NuoE [Caldicoprobacterales bacterium]|jgi:NADH:ubiquinone oxidoreductase subunit E|nr:NADH-quinone oxidoreductase subunit NuoE [Clostridiales bacterium]